MVNNLLPTLLLLLGLVLIVSGFYLINYQRKRNANTANFLYTLTHDSLSNPIQNANVAVQNIEREVKNEDTCSKLLEGGSIQDLKVELNRLSRTSHNLRQLALLEVDQSSEVRERINLVSVAQRVVLDLGAEAENAGVKLLYEGRNQRLTVLQQPEYAHNIIKNIIHNAIKHCADLEDPLVVISVSTVGRYAKIVVSDNGAGISPEQLKSLTAVPQRPMAWDIGKFGSGLGLYLVKRLVEQCRGKLHIESEPGKGTKVTITLPMLNAAE